MVHYRQILFYLTLNVQWVIVAYKFAICSWPWSVLRNSRLGTTQTQERGTVQRSRQHLNLSKILQKCTLSYKKCNSWANKNKFRYCMWRTQIWTKVTGWNKFQSRRWTMWNMCWYFKPFPEDLNEIQNAIWVVLSSFLPKSGLEINKILKSPFVD